MSSLLPMPDDEREIRDHLDAAGWVRVMRHLAERHGLSAHEPTPYASGSDAVWRVGDCVIKLSTPEWAQQIAREASALEHVEGRLGIDTPRLIAHGALEGWPYVISSRLQSEPLAAHWGELDAHARRGLARELGELTRALHALPAPAWEDGFDAFWARCRTNVAARHHEAVNPPELEARIDPLLAELGELDDGERVFAHTELLDHHLYLRREGEGVRLAGLIDFADAMLAPRAYDFPAVAEFVLRGERGLWGAFVEGYGGGAAALDPLHLFGWSLSHRYGRLRRALEAVGEPRPQSLEELAVRLYGSAD